MSDTTVGIFEDAALRPLLRLHQLARDIQRALAREDMAVLSQASNLLAPTLAQWAETRPLLDPNDEDVQRLTAETRGALNDCENSMQAAMKTVEAQMNRVRQHRRRLQAVRKQRPSVPQTGHRVDARR